MDYVVTSDLGSSSTTTSVKGCIDFCSDRGAQGGYYDGASSCVCKGAQEAHSTLYRGPCVGVGFYHDAAMVCQGSGLNYGQPDSMPYKAAQGKDFRLFKQRLVQPILRLFIPQDANVSPHRYP